MREPSEKQFLKDVSGHAMTILADNGVHRCVRFAAGDSWNQYFTLTTWPGHLCISGDMGTFVFHRLTDMFEFFRGPAGKDALYINTGYWEEKCEASDRRTNGTEVYSEDRFKSAVVDDFKQHDFESAKAKRECWKEIKERVLIAENEYEAHRYAAEFEHDGFTFCDFWENNLKSYTYHYVWCCYAIAWGVRQYDVAKGALETAMAG